MKLKPTYGYMQSLQTLAAVAALTLLTPNSGSAQGTAFTYQGHLKSGASPANGSHDFVFTLKNALNGGSTVGTAVAVNGASVTDGTFTTSLDFGSTAFSGGERWLEISVNGTILSPRQLVTPSPIALGLPNVYTLGGKVGIGTSNPRQSLDVQGGGVFYGHTQMDPGDGHGPAVRIGYTTVAGSSTSEHGYISAGHTGVAPKNLVLQGIAGNVGIGNLDPKQKLDVRGGGVFHGNSLMDPGDGLGPAVRIGYTTGTPEYGYVAAGHTGGSNRNLVLQASYGGNVGIGTTTPTERLTVAGNVKCTTVIITSDRDKKDGFASVDAREVLEKVAAMPITKWHYKSETDVNHIGPMAQDFHAAFGIDTDDKHIATVDADGIALAAIKGLSEIVEEKDARIQALEQRLARLERLLAK